jgi:hypothetical protein
VTKLDEISAAIGEMRADVRNLSRNTEADRQASDRRHRENLRTLASIDKRVDSIEAAMTPLAATVTDMKPVVEAWKITRWKLAGALLLATIILGFVGWVASLFTGKLAALFLAMFTRPA